MSKDGKEKNARARELYPVHLAQLVDKKLEEYLNSYTNVPQELLSPMKYCVLDGGKRFRPVLCLATAVSLGYSAEYVLPTACAIEFIHSYSLIHDDLPAIDNDDMRRGKPSCHKKFGEDIAILAGDALFAEAFALIIKDQQGSPELIKSVMAEIIEGSGAGGMVAGQIVDITTTSVKISKERLEYMHINKTARLIAASVVCPAILCGADKNTIDGFREYGLNMGLAFQITDDIIDITSNSEETGKTRGKDQYQSKNTYPSIWGMEESKRIAREKIDAAIAALNKTKADSEILKNIASFIIVRRA